MNEIALDVLRICRSAPIWLSLALGLGGCSAGELAAEAHDLTGTTEMELLAKECRSEADCVAPAGPCFRCPDQVTFSCPAAACELGRCEVGYTSCPDECDPTLLCQPVITCVDGQSYPTSCGPDNCDEPLGECSAGQD